MTNAAAKHIEIENRPVLETIATLPAPTLQVLFHSSSIGASGVSEWRLQHSWTWRSEMNLKLLVGIVIFVIGLITAVVGIVGVGQPEVDAGPPMVVEENRSLSIPDGAGSPVLPWVAGLALAVGGLLIGISFGNFKHPRTHLEPGDAVVDPEGYHKMKHV